MVNFKKFKALALEAVNVQALTTRRVVNESFAPNFVLAESIEEMVIMIDDELNITDESTYELLLSCFVEDLLM